MSTISSSLRLSTAGYLTVRYGTSLLSTFEKITSRMQSGMEGLDICDKGQALKSFTLQGSIFIRRLPQQHGADLQSSARTVGHNIKPSVGACTAS